MNENGTRSKGPIKNKLNQKYLKWIGIGVCGVAILSLTLYLTQAKEMPDSAIKDTDFSKSEQVVPKKELKKEQRESNNKKKETVEDVYKNYGISPNRPSAVSRNNAGYSSLSSSDLGTISRVLNEKKDEGKVATTIPTTVLPVLPTPTPAVPDQEVPKPKPKPDPVDPIPVINKPTISLTQNSVVVGQGDIFSPYDYFTIDNGGDTATTIQVSTVETTELGQYYCTIIATNSAGMDEKTLPVLVNGRPTITVLTEVIDIPVRSQPDLLSFATANDAEDGDISSSLTFTSDVDTNKEGEYTVTYTAVDSHGFTVSKTVTAKVTNEAPIIHATDLEIEIDQPFNVLDHVKVTDREDGEIKLSNENVLKNNVDTSKEGIYEVTIGDVKDSDGKNASEKTFKVTVKNELPVIEIPDTVLIVGETFNVETFKQSVKVTDREDDKKNVPVKVTFDEEALKQVSTDKPNTFIIAIEATDSHGGKSTMNAKIVVEEKKESEPDPKDNGDQNKPSTEIKAPEVEQILIKQTVVQTPTVSEEPKVNRSIEENLGTIEATSTDKLPTLDVKSEKESTK